jgi:hypothetical protein
MTNPIILNPKTRTALVILCLLGGTAAAAWTGSRFSINRTIPRTEIYRGVFYRAFRADRGMVHLVEVDLSHPGVEFYVTPLDPTAQANGYQYRLDYVRNVARSEGLSVAVNGPLFSSDSFLTYMVGDFADSVDSMVSNYKVSHLNPSDFMFSFDEQLRPHVQMTNPIPAGVLQNTKWGIGGLSVKYGTIPPAEGEVRDNQSLLGVNPETRRLWIGVFESSTESDAVREILRAGAKYALILDGGNSSSLYLGDWAHEVPAGLRFGGQRPVATVIGVKADPILPRR